jgi:signal transduction histidine kinase
MRQNIESKVVAGLQDSRQPDAEEYKNVLENISEYVRTFSSSEDYRNSVLSSLLWVVGTGLILVIFQIVLLTVFFSHKIAGPVYRFERVCNNMIEGNYTDVIKLRKGDEMQNLASLLNEVVKTSRERIQQLGTVVDEEERKKIFYSIQI